MPCSLTTDGTFAWLRLDLLGKPSKGFVLDGSFVRYRGEEIYRGGGRDAQLFFAAD